MSEQTLGIGGHQAAHRGRTNDWLTPLTIIERLGAFDLDPACPPNMPWRTAARMLTPAENGLAVEWAGRVWLNPPYGAETPRWLGRLAEHGNGVALTFARTETAGWFDAVWARADALLFFRGRLHFYRIDGRRAAGNCGGPSVLIAYGADNARALESCDIPGALVWTPKVRDGRPVR